MTARKLRFIVPLCTVIALTCACSKSATDASSTTSANGIAQMIDKAEKASAAANDAPSSGDALKPNERVQGTIQLDVGKGATSFRSIATKIPDDLGKTAAARMDTAAGQKDLKNANAKVGGGRTNVSAKDVQDIANAFAGRTIYTSQMMSLAIVNLRLVEMTAISPDGRKANLVIRFPIDSDTPIDANLSYHPNPKKPSWEFESEDEGVQVTLDRFERVNDKTLSIAGTFKAGKLMPSPGSDELKGQEVADASGSFDFTEINIRPEK